MKKYTYRTTYLLGVIAIVCLLAWLLQSCSHSTDLPCPDRDTLQERIISLPDELTAQTIRIELREGHSHLPKNPELGALYWSDLNSGFHANPAYGPDESKYPFRTLQTMVFRRQKDGSFAIDPQSGTDAFRVQTAPTSGGTWQALLVTLYDKNNKRIDLDFRKGSLKDRSQIFYEVHDMKPITQDRPEKGIEKQDTCISYQAFTSQGLSASTVEQIHKLSGDLIPMYYHTSIAPYKAGTPADSVFSYFYYDRATDDAFESPLLKTPVGFRGTIANRVPYVSYQVDVRLTVLPEETPKQQPYSGKPTREQLAHTVWKLTVPFRNIMEKYDENVTFSPQVMRILNADPNYDEFVLSDLVGDKTAVMGMHLNVLREYPGYTLQELTQWYADQLRNSNPESSNFWL